MKHSYFLREVSRDFKNSRNISIKTLSYLLGIFLQRDISSRVYKSLLLPCNFFKTSICFDLSSKRNTQDINRYSSSGFFQVHNINLCSRG